MLKVKIHPCNLNALKQVRKTFIYSQKPNNEKCEDGYTIGKEHKAIKFKLLFS